MSKAIDRLKNHVELIKSEIENTYASNEVYLLSLGNTILANTDTMPELLQELSEYGEICNSDDSICLTCINDVYYIDTPDCDEPSEYNTAEIAIARFIDALSGDFSKC